MLLKRLTQIAAFCGLVATLLGGLNLFRYLSDVSARDIPGKGIIALHLLSVVLFHATLTGFLFVLASRYKKQTGDEPSRGISPGDTHVRRLPPLHGD
jgi:hypothetical protein